MSPLPLLLLLLLLLLLALPAAAASDNCISVPGAGTGGGAPRERVLSCVSARCGSAALPPTVVVTSSVYRSKHREEIGRVCVCVCVETRARRVGWAADSYSGAQSRVTGALQGLARINRYVMQYPHGWACS